MSSFSRWIALALLAAAFALVHGGAFAANPEPVDIEPDILALLAKERSRTAQQSRQKAAIKQGNKEQSTAECGAINIGNVVGGGRIGFAPTDVNVVIVGDIVNANNKCN